VGERGGCMGCVVWAYGSVWVYGCMGDTWVIHWAYGSVWVRMGEWVCGREGWVYGMCKEKTNTTGKNKHDKKKQTRQEKTNTTRKNKHDRKKQTRQEKTNTTRKNKHGGTWVIHG
jgi:hypothetical protein